MTEATTIHERRQRELKLFEATLNASKTTGPWNFSKMEVNGQFHHYMDSDTDTAWIGWALSANQKRGQ